VQAQTTLRVPVVSRTIFYLPAWTPKSRALQAGRPRREARSYDASDKDLQDCAPAHTRSESLDRSVRPNPIRAARFGSLRLAKRRRISSSRSRRSRRWPTEGKTIGVVSMKEAQVSSSPTIAKHGGIQLGRGESEAARRHAAAAPRSARSTCSPPPAAVSAEI